MGKAWTHLPSQASERTNLLIPWFRTSGLQNSKPPSCVVCCYSNLRKPVPSPLLSVKSDRGTSGPKVGWHSDGADLGSRVLSSEIAMQRCGTLHMSPHSTHMMPSTGWDCLCLSIPLPHTLQYWQSCRAAVMGEGPGHTHTHRWDTTTNSLNLIRDWRQEAMDFNSLRDDILGFLVHQLF